VKQVNCHEANMNYYDSITTLHRYAQRRHYFDPSNRQDLDELLFFKKHHKWRSGCPFYLEWPFGDVLTMCDSKYSEHMLARLK
jgi:hypothetical protein